MKKSARADKTFRLCVAQLDPVVGDIAGNLALARQAREQARADNADLVLFSELFICGYSPEDMARQPAFIAACEAAVLELAWDTADGGAGVIIGTPLLRKGRLYNAVVVLDKGKIIAERYKIDLPNYDEFDERRVFVSGEDCEPVKFRGLSLGLPICEDIWNKVGICKMLADKGAELLLVANASPYSRDKPKARLAVVKRQVKESGLPLVYVNQFGGQDELVFDGGSFALHADGSRAFQMAHFAQSTVTTVWEKTQVGWTCMDGMQEKLFSGHAADYTACMVGLRDYVNKNGFKDVLLGLSGGMDSALCAALAVDALGAERVRTIMLPYRYTSQSSFSDAQACVDALGCRYDTIPIAAPVEGFMRALEPLFAGTENGVTEENLQSRARGVILMAVSNKFGALVITTGNKSEMAVGYATLYGDMNGGFNPIKDVYKTQVYALSAWRNKHKPADAMGKKGMVIPQSILDKAPSAELREGQTDQDTLPPYDKLDDILECLIEKDMDVAAIVAKGYEKDEVERIERLFYLAEYKRRQAAPGVKVTVKSLGRDRHYPITNRFRTILK
ncbi:MAG: NAD synthetase [Candidatus Tokpelaia hoelldobleri]|uniref:Glutamine-dependent NAD(+) synthetase n=1 Tax=Candidatus Tokpelaia hoelldobleri TaxID=1902579 RepID=A0A1U9JUF4_9HYPH|nr:MAG: NAD synthetase [Candidatus Tokpelaia hoelldoblerii]